MKSINTWLLIDARSSCILKDYSRHHFINIEVLELRMTVHEFVEMKSRNSSKGNHLRPRQLKIHFDMVQRCAGKIVSAKHSRNFSINWVTDIFDVWNAQTFGLHYCLPVTHFMILIIYFQRCPIFWKLRVLSGLCLFKKMTSTF